MTIQAQLVTHKIKSGEITIEYLYGIASRTAQMKFLSWLLVDPVDGVIKFTDNKETKNAIKDVADLLDKSLIEKISNDQFRRVERAAYAAYAAANAVYAAYAAAYAANAANAANAVYAANAAVYAANAAVYAANAAAKKRQTEKFIELIIKYEKHNR